MAVIEHGKMYAELRAAIGAFMAEFATLEALHLNNLIRALTHDQELVGLMEELMPLEQRSTLLKRLAQERVVSEPLLARISKARSKLKKLEEFRNEIAHGAAVGAVGSAIPGEAVAGEAVPGVEEWFAGVRRPRSKRKKLPPDPRAFVEAIQSQYHRVPTIDKHTEQVIALQAEMIGLARDLWGLRSGSS